MDLKISGKFIKEMRKEKGLTQIELAEKLFVSEKTISKWECGNGFPDTSLMLPLCKELGITANELLSGKKLGKDDYKTKAEENLMLLQAEHQRSAKFLLTLEIVLGFFSAGLLLTLILISGFVDMAVWAKVLIIVTGFVLFFVGVHFCLLIEKDAGYYECKHCHHKHIPSLKQVYWSKHMGRTRYMKCPKCNKRSWQKKVIK